MKQNPSPEIIERLNFITNHVSQYIVEGKYDEANELQEEFYQIENIYDLFDRPFEENGRIGLKEITGKILVPPLYQGFPELYSYTIKRGDPVVASNETGKCALVSTDGQGTPLTEFQYDNIECKHFTAFYTCYKKIEGKVKIGILCNSGRELVPCEMDNIFEVYNDIIEIEKDDKHGLLTIWGLYVPPIYDEIEEEESGLVRLRNGEQWGYISDDGTFITKDFDDIDLSICLLSFSPDF